ncbi:MAG: TetR/AcrR family transcriptional regulator [Ignavibacteriae bacterium]|nr:TetR/AcrR family transcriptional regulator [Ignavibacteriota bacterium]
MKFTEKQSHIISTSIELIAEKSIQGFTIKNLAAKLKVTEGAIYRHFKSKADILLGILKSFQNESDSILERACTSELPALEDIENIFIHHFNFFAKKPAVAAVIFSESIFEHSNKLSKEVMKLLKTHEDALMCIITRGQLSGEIRNGAVSKEQLVRIIIGSIRYTVTKWRLSNYKFNIKKEGKSLLANIKELLKK